MKGEQLDKEYHGTPVYLATGDKLFSNHPLTKANTGTLGDQLESSDSPSALSFDHRPAPL